MINLFEPDVGEAELAAVEGVFASRWLGAGECVERFERAFGDHLGLPADELVAVTSCTEALFQVLAALGLGPGDEVVLPTVSFIGAAHAVAGTGATCVLTDVDPATLNPTLEQVEGVITSATRAILPLHFGGLPGEVAEIAALAKERSIPLVEDAAVGLGSFAGERACGTLGDAGVWSFDAMKLLTTGDGGMVWSRNRTLVDQVRRNVKLGLGPTGFRQRDLSQRWWEIDPTAVGRRGAMNSIAAAIGLAQLEKLPRFLRRRDEIARTYDIALNQLSWLSLQRWPPTAARSFYWIQVEPGVRDRLAAHMLAAGVYTTFKYWPLHRTRMYSSSSAFPGADRAAATTLLLPMHQGLREDDVGRVIAAIGSFEP
ncbi:MAG TPA: DegT/DnrJ/EryC1/StrS family aminotransferase [Solirubrobacterales bacterium]